MAPLPSNNTSVLFVDYTVQAHQHTVQCRYAEPATFVEAMDAVDAWFTALSTAIGETTIDGARYRLEGTNVAIDVTWTGASGYGTGTGGEDFSAQYAGFIGRSAGGRRVRVYAFGLSFIQFGNNYRASAGENAILDDARDTIAAASDVWLAIDGQPAIWKTYINNGENAYWRNQIR